MSSPSAVLFCPGRGSYARDELGFIGRHLRPGPVADALLRADAERQNQGLPTITELDSADKFRPSLHLDGENAAGLIYFGTLVHAEHVRGNYRIAAVAGNSLGWYTALAVAGALDFDDGYRLVQEISILQHKHGAGGQIVFPLIDDQWHFDPKLVAAMNEALAEAPGEAYPSIDLGGYAVLAGTETGIDILLEKLPPVEMGPTGYPMRLAQHGPYHTPIVRPVAEGATATLGRLDFKPPKITLIDGRGRRHSPWSTDPQALRAYTLGVQLVTPYGFTTSVRVALREDAPDYLVLPGPGNTLGGICGQILVAEGYRGIRRRDEFDRVQESDAPVVISMRRF